MTPHSFELKQPSKLNATYKPVHKTFSKFTLYLFLMISVYLVVPIIEIPFMGLSISAPLMFLVVLEAIFRPPRPWTKVYRPYIILAVLIWAGIFLSAIVNGLLSGGVNINSEGILTVIRYAYWLLIFIVVVYVVSVGNLPSVLFRVLGWSIFLLALVRWGEALVYGSIGAEFRLNFLPQNTYGIQFSAFSLFLLGLALSEKGWKKTIALAANILLWGAIAINGSRGSWVGVAVGIAILLMILILARQSNAFGLAIGLILTGGLALLIFSSSSQVSQAVESRLNSFQNLNEEKSYAIRQLMNQKSLRLFEESPIFGAGAGRFTFSSVELDIPRVLQYAGQEHFYVKSSHNSYLGFLAENGLVGAIPFAILLIFLCISGLKAAILLARLNQYWGAMIYAGFIGMSVHMWVISALTGTATWYIYGMVAAMIILARTMSKEPS